MKMTKMKCEKKKNTWEKKYKQWMEGNKQKKISLHKNKTTLQSKRAIKCQSG